MHKTTKTIGVLGGMGSAATVDFYRRIIEATDTRQDQDHLRILIDNNPAVPDRTQFLLGYGLDPTPALIAMAASLAYAGADLLIIACNTASAFVSQVAATVPVPLLNWVNEAASGVASRRPYLKKCGLLATTGTVNSQLYHEAFEKLGISVAVPNQNMQENVMEAIYGLGGVKAGNISAKKNRLLVEQAARHLQETGVEAILLGCTELSLLYAAQSPLWAVPTFDAAQIVAERMVVLAGGKLKPVALPHSFDTFDDNFDYELCLV